MRLVLPGKPQAKSQALCTTRWKGRRVVAYISGNALIILGGPNEIIQTIYHDRAEDLDAVAIDESTGKIAVCWASTVYVYRPYERLQDLPRWSLQCSFEAERSSLLPQTLSWGSSAELLVGSDALRLYETADEDHLIWNRQLASPIMIATFSHDASLIVSVAQHDRLAKVWRRRSYGSDDVRFDYSYLPHPSAITGAQWRRPEADNYHEKHVLYTVCADYKIRIWAAMDAYALQLLQPWAEIDLQASIQPRVEPVTSAPDRYVFMIDSMEFSQAISSAVLSSGNSSAKRHFIEHLLEIDTARPDICVVLDSRGHLSAWALDRIGPKTKSPVDAHNIAHLEDFNAFSSQSEFAKSHDIQMLSFASNERPSQLCLLGHRHDGTITWWEGDVTEFFDPCSNSARLQEKARWAGHERSIERIVPSLSGKSFLSWSSNSEVIVWKCATNSFNDGLVMHSIFKSKEAMIDACHLDELDIILALHGESLTLWTCQERNGRTVKRQKLEKTVLKRSISQIQTPGLDMLNHSQLFAVFTSPMSFTVWKVTRNDSLKTDIITESSSTVTLHKNFCINLDFPDQLLSSIELTQSTRNSTIAMVPKISIQRDEIVMCLSTGSVYAYKLQIKDSATASDSHIGNMSSELNFDTNVESPRLMAVSPTSKLALVDETGSHLTIWDVSTGMLEHSVKYATASLTCLRWLATSTGLSALAVGFAHKIIILAGTRLDQSEVGLWPWKEVREIEMQEQTSQEILDFTWLGDQTLVIASGIQLLAVNGALPSRQALANDSPISVSGRASLELSDALEVLNCSLPVYHPVHILQMTLAGQAVLGERVLKRLYNTLKFFSDGDVILSGLDVPTESFYSFSSGTVNGSKIGPQIPVSEFDEDGNLTSDEAFELLEKIKSINLPHFAKTEQDQLECVVGSLNLDKKTQQSLDHNGTRFLTLFKHFVNSPQGAPMDAQTISWREMAWAYHSQSQEVLLDRVSRHFDGKMHWQSAKKAGIFMWITDHTALRTHFEAIARNEYVKSDERNPIDCSLYYLALKKKNILQGLWRMASWNKEQASTQKLLANNFANPRWKTAALKNAYALLGRRRFEYAAAFFLLADNLRDAVNICANQMNDLQLAIAVARVYEGNDNGDVLQDLLRNRVLPEAAATGNRWMASWAFWIMGSGQGKSGMNDKRRAMEVLLVGPESVVPPTKSRSLESKSILNTEPAQAVLYRQLREQLPASEVRISPKQEWSFVLQMAQLYLRMGCGLLALDLLRNWKFVEIPKEERSASGSDSGRKTGDVDGSSEEEEEEEDDENERENVEEKEEVKVKAPLKPAFQEPSTSSLLDSFGY